jgi:hypothetical protein
LLASTPHAAIKLAPGAKLSPKWESSSELEWISRGRECRQLVAWRGDLAELPGKRRATVLFHDDNTVRARTFIGDANVGIPIADRPDQYVFDVDAAVLAAKLKGALSAEHGLHALSFGPTYLPLRIPALAKYLSERGIGQLEIKKRGADIDPEQLRTSLKLRGTLAAVLLITLIGGRPAAILGRRPGRG